MPESSSTPVWDELASANQQLQSGQYVCALNSFRETLSKHRDQGATELLGRTHFGCALALLALGERVAATQEFEAAFKQETAHVEGGLRWADMLLAARRLPEAKMAYEAVLAFLPENAEAHYGLGVCLLHLGLRTEAKTAFDTALRLVPSYPAAIIATALLTLFDNPPVQNLTLARRPMLCILLSPFVQYWLGGQTYLVNFVRTMAMMPRDRRPRLIVAVLVDDWRASETIRDTMNHLLACDAVEGAFDRRGDVIALSPLMKKWTHRSGEGSKAHRKIFATVAHSFPLLYPSWGLETLGRPLYWIPDFQHHFMPSNFDTNEVRSRSIDMIGLAERDVPIVFSSRDAASHFDKFYPSHTARGHIWHFHSIVDAETANVEPALFETLGLPERYFYVPNQFWIHKGHITVFQAARLLLDRGVDLTIACTGSNFSNSDDPYCLSMLSLIDELNLREHIRLLGVLPMALQREVMRRSCAVIQPSTFEGWSTVVEDARSAGRPLIVSDIAVHVEQVGKAGIFFRAGDCDSLAAAIAVVYSSLAAGPDEAMESRARREVAARVRQSSAQFMRILDAERTRLAGEPPAPLTAGRGATRSI